MIEHYVLSCARPGTQPVRPSAHSDLKRDEETGSTAARYGAVELANIADGATGDNSSESTPLRGSDVDLAATDREHSSAGDDLYSRVISRGLIVSATTLIATTVPCFGVVRRLSLDE
jgi:hypothetical protein